MRITCSDTYNIAKPDNGTQRQPAAVLFIQSRFLYTYSSVCKQKQKPEIFGQWWSPWGLAGI